MEVSDVAPALQERLGSEATAGLLALFTTARQEWTADVTTAAVERFERRLSEELSELRDEMSGMRIALAQTEATLRQEIVHGDASVRQEIGSLAAQLRKEMHDQGVELRKELVAQGAELRKEMVAQGAELRKDLTAQGADLRRELGEHTGSLRKDMADLGREMSLMRQEQLASRFELLKWAFVFWVGQAVAVAGIVGVMLRFIQA